MLILSLEYDHALANTCSFYIIAKIFFAYATLASFLLQFYVPMDFLEPVFLERMKPSTSKDIKFLVQIFFRSVVVLFIGQCSEDCNCSCLKLLLLQVLVLLLTTHGMFTVKLYTYYKDHQ